MPTQQEVQKELAKKKLERLRAEVKARKAGAGGAFGTSAGVTFGDAALGSVSTLPKFLFDTVPSYIAAGAQGLVGSHGDPGMLFGGDFDFGRRLANQEDDKTLLQKGLGNIPQPETSDVAGVVGAIKQNPAHGKAFGEAFREDKMAFEQEQAALEKMYPKATFSGGITGDIATLLSMKLPMSPWLKRVEQGTLNKVLPVAETKRLRDAYKIILNSEPVRRLARVRNRSLEAGAEAMALDILNSDDPMETAVYAAAGQLAASSLLGAAQQIVKGGLGPTGAKVLAASLATGSLWQVLKDMTPGGRDSLLESFEFGYEKVTLALIFGGLAGLGGAGRFRGDTNMTNAAARVLDALATVPRAGVISILEEMVDAQPEEQQRMEVVLQRFLEAPEGMGRDATKVIEKAIESGKLNEAIEVLYEKNAQFRNWLDEE